MATKITTIERRPRALSPQAQEVHVYDTGLNGAEVLTQVAYFVFAVIETLLAIRFILRLVGASPFNDVVAWVYNTTSLLVLPFQGIFPSQVSDGAVLEISSILAMVGYLIVFYLVVALFRVFVHDEKLIDVD